MHVKGDKYHIYKSYCNSVTRGALSSSALSYPMLLKGLRKTERVTHLLNIFPQLLTTQLLY